MGNNDSKSPKINNVIDTLVSRVTTKDTTDNLKLNKIIQIRYTNNNDIMKELKKILVDFNINTYDKEGKNLLHIFAAASNIEILKIILDHGCDINKKDNLGYTPIFYAYETNYDFFIKHGADLNLKNNKGRTILYEESRYYFTDSIKKLLNAQNCGDVYEQFEKHELLHKAILFQDIPKMKELMSKNKFLVNASIKDLTITKTEHFLSPLYIACRNGLYDELLCLLEHGADIHQNKLLLNMMCIINMNDNHIKIIKKLIELGINVNDVNDKGDNLLHNCYSSITHEKIVDIFLEAGVNIHAKTLTINFSQPNYTRYSKLITSNAEPLQLISIFNKNIKIYQKLFEYGADPNVQNNYGINAFMVICSNEYLGYRYNEIDNILEIIKLFVDNGADISLTDNFGNTALDIIYCNQYISNEMKVKIVKYLHKKFKFIVVKSKTNNFLYDMLVEDKFTPISEIKLKE